MNARQTASLGLFRKKVLWRANQRCQNPQKTGETQLLCAAACRKGTGRLLHWGRPQGPSPCIRVPSSAFSCRSLQLLAVMLRALPWWVLFGLLPCGHAFFRGEDRPLYRCTIHEAPRHARPPQVPGVQAAVPAIATELPNTANPCLEKRHKESGGKTEALA